MTELVGGHDYELMFAKLKNENQLLRKQLFQLGERYDKALDDAKAIKLRRKVKSFKNTARQEIENADKRLKIYQKDMMGLSLRIKKIDSDNYIDKLQNTVI